MSLALSTTDFDIEIGLPAGAHDASLESQIWLLLCARTLTEVDASVSDTRAGDIAVAVLASADYRSLDAVAAAYLWLARTGAGSPGDELL